MVSHGLTLPFGVFDDQRQSCRKIFDPNNLDDQARDDVSSKDPAAHWCGLMLLLLMHSKGSTGQSILASVRAHCASYRR